MRMGFQAADASVDDQNFLAVFQQRGCYLVDLCHEPVDRLDMDQRRTLRKAGERDLARQLKCLRPVMIAAVLRSIVNNVENAASLAAWQGRILQFPYPGRWSRHREAFIQALAPIVRRLKTPASLELR